MQRTICILLLLAGLSLPSSLASGSAHSSYRLKYSYSSNPVHVRSYTRKDGTYVPAHSRSLPRTSNIGRQRLRFPRRYTPCTSRSQTYTPRAYSSRNRSMSRVARDKRGRIKRSAAAKDQFKREHPCPTTGRGSGPCPGYVIDHLKPLECGGADSPSNMQWQTISDGKAKDKTERTCR